LGTETAQRRTEATAEGSVMTDYVPDDAMSEAAAARHVPNANPKGRPKYQASDTDVVLKIRVDKQTYKDLLRIATRDDHGIEGYCRRMVKERIKDQRRADAINFLIAHKDELTEFIQTSK
jgi:hypothetical protein